MEAWFSRQFRLQMLQGSSSLFGGLSASPDIIALEIRSIVRCNLIVFESFMTSLASYIQHTDMTEK